MAFDASVIAEIGGNTPDVSGSQAKALTLADLYDRNQLSKIEVAGAKQNQADMTYAKQILAGKDLSKLEDQNRAVAEITKRNPQLGMQLARGFTDQQSAKNDLDLQQLKLHEAKNDIMGAAIEPLKAKHDQLLQQLQAKNPKANPQQLEQQVDQAMREDMFGAIKGLVGQKLPNGQPVLNEQDVQFIQANFKTGYNPQAVDMIVARSKQAREAIAQKLKERDENRKEKATDAAIALGGRRADQGDRKISDAERSAALKIKMAGEGKFTEEDADWLAEQYIAGDKSVMVGLGRGAQGPQHIIMVRHAIAREAKSQGMKPADLAARLAEYQGYVSEQRSLGTQQANVEMASSEAQQMIANARQASAAVPRAVSLGWNKVMQMTDKQLNDPELASLKAATTAVINTWASAINPKGVATVADKDHGYELLNSAQDEPTYTAVLDRFQQETEASLAAPQGAKQRLHDAFISGQTPTAAPPPGPGSLQPTPGRGAAAPGAPAAMPPAAAPPAAGHTVLRFDAQGNPIT
jgi:hypothetical protein